MSIKSKLSGLKGKLRGKFKGTPTRSGATFKPGKVGKFQKLQGKLQQKFGKNTGTCAPACGPDDPACNAGFTRVDFIGVLGAAMFVVFCVALALTYGCATQPSRSQTMTVENNTINVYVLPPAVPGALCYSNNLPLGVTGGDILCQAMMIETGGNEANVAEASHSPQLNLPVGDTAVSALGELIGAAIAGGTKALTKEEEPVTTTTP